MNLNDPQVSHAITLVMEQLNKQDKYRLTDLLMEFEELTQLPEKWQMLIKAQIGKHLKAQNHAKRIKQSWKT
jgi:hypothetical protein